MAERQSNEFRPSADPPYSFADASSSLPLGPHSDQPEPPVVEHNQWGDPPAALGPNAFSGADAAAPQYEEGATYQPPDRPGSHSADPVDDTTVGDRSPRADDAPRPGPPTPAQDLGAPSGFYGQTSPRPPSQLDRAQQQQQPYDAPPRPGEQPPPEHSTTPPSPDAGPGRPSPGWQPPPQPPQQPPAPQRQPAGAWPDDDRGWTHAQGSAANWNYVDSIRSSELVPTRRIPPVGGWRKAVYVGSFKQINLGLSPDEREQAELEAKIRSLLRGKYKIGVLGKGGVGKSTIAASVGSVFAELRKDDRVVAIDADTAFGKLASLIDPAASGSYWELAADRELFAFTDIRSRLGSNKAGLFVLPGEAATARRRVVDAKIYREATEQLDKHFTLSIVDCGSTLDSPVTREVLGDLDALIVVSSPWFGGASAAGQTLEWLANCGYTGLLHRTVVVVNDSDGHAAKRDRKLLVERFGGRGQKVLEMPYDEHLRPGGPINVKDEVNRGTRRSLMKLAAACAEHFAATTDRPRRAR